jgi:AsmA protein
LARQLQGRASLVVRQGELVGIGLSDVLKRAERRPLSAPLEWRGGRTPFDQAQIALTIAKGVGEVAEAQVTGPAARAILQGRVSLAERTLALKATVEGTAAPMTAGASPAAGASMLFDITGPWASPAMLPDVRALIERSGAARQLLRPELGARARSDALEASSTAAQ